MKKVNVYTAQPENAPLAVALLELQRRGWRVVVRPVAELPRPAPPAKP